MPQITAEHVDRLCGLEFRVDGTNIPRGTVHRLYAAARHRAQGPLMYGAAQAMISAVSAKDRVLIVTGAGAEPYFPKAEVDGLPGAAAIARALHFGCEAEVHVAVEERALDPMVAAIRAAELSPVVQGVDQHAPTDAVRIHVSPIPEDEGRAFSDAMLDGLQPTLVLAIEKLSESANDGRIKGATGVDWHDTHYKPKYLFDRARGRGILTVGIGDGGNEVGFGVLPEVAEIVPSGPLSRAATEVDHLIVAGVSDWGGYGLATMLAILVRNPEASVDGDLIERMIRGVVDAGALDGLSARPVLADDGYPLIVQRSVGDILRTMVSHALAPSFVSPGH